MKGIIFTVCFLLCLVSVSFSQESNSVESSSILITFPKQKKDIRILVLKKLDKYINSKELFSKQKNNVFLFSIGLSVDSLGNVDDIFFSDSVTKNKTKIIIVNEHLIADFKKMHLDDFGYRSKILILPILFKRPDDDKISNLNEFLSGFSSLWPIFATDSMHKVVLLEPLINNFFDPIN
ncbi:hypothetical protein EZ456_03070 [Pedobacter psychrodurus]|uniref:Uncharacterized protein n=1 Tax=Pedobacter psychrodurus TaxID=2530456 RepID=A0A4R0QAP2_9SPHI|nr:hypothetical protein [Pedobacter psychrodurus]TCD29155.1 hypothetical protein EZ456_03070 [Pedobacter psychrodurus]